MSKCGVCKKEKEKMKSASICQECADKRKEYYRKNSDKIKAASTKWKKENKNKVKKSNRTWHVNNKEKLKVYKNKRRSTPKYRFSKAKMLARRRGIDFQLTLDEYIYSISFPCYYCNGEFGKVNYGIGLDRVDNSKGYLLNNVLSCCKQCNSLKSDWLTCDEAKVAIDAILHIRKNKEDL